jgi:putative endonuclease
MGFVYVYIPVSLSVPKHFYIGFTQDLKDRLRRHNAGEVPHTAKFRPWRIKTALAFTDSERALEFEREDFMKPLGLSAYAVAKAIGATPIAVSEIVRGKRAVSAEMALKLGRLFNVSPEL